MISRYFIKNNSINQARILRPKIIRKPPPPRIKYNSAPLMDKSRRDEENPLHLSPFGDDGQRAGGRAGGEDVPSHHGPVQGRDLQGLLTLDHRRKHRVHLYGERPPAREQERS